jgi:UDP-2,3-diacylglucosamine pyrophosphatase LpxH
MTSEHRRYRSIFLSDFHLGSPHCQSVRLQNFLARNDAGMIYLVGDIIEANNHFKWPVSHGDVIRELSNKMQRGTKITYIPGNHDRIFLNYIGNYHNLTIAKCAKHTMTDGNVLLIVHGDENDRFKSWTLLHLLLAAERIVAKNLWELVRKHLGRVINRHERKFEEAMISYARTRSFYGIVCGHVHMPKIANLLRGGTIYINCGDWIHHCTAVVEHFDGSFEMIRG